MTSSNASRLREYGMYIRRNKQNMFNLGWTDAPRPGGLGAFPTYDDAYEAFDQIVGQYWEYKAEDFQRYVEDQLGLWLRGKGR